MYEDEIIRILLVKPKSFVINVEICRALGLINSIVLSSLLEQSVGYLIGEYYQYSIKTLVDSGLSVSKVLASINDLKTKNIISCCVRDGVRLVIINYHEILKYIAIHRRTTEDKEIPVRTREKTSMVLEKTHEIISFWNSLPNVRKHRVGTKTFAHLLRSFSMLRRGIFFSDKKFNDKWIKRLDITADLLGKCWTDDQMKVVFVELSKLHNVKYWPVNKTGIPIGLPELLFDNITGRSWFLEVCIDPPKKIHSIDIGKGMESLFEVGIDILCLSKGKPKELSSFEDKEFEQIGKTVASVLEQYERLHSKTKITLGSPFAFIERYKEYLENKGIKDLPIGFWGTNSTNWRDFLVKLSNSIRTDLYSGEAK